MTLIYVKVVSSLLCLLFINPNNIGCDNVQDTGELIFAHVIFRHGDRTPVDPYPTDPWRFPEYWPTGWGQLTNLGKQQHYELGQWLRKRYRNLVNETYSKEEIQIRSTDVDRTLMSALANLAGLYPPKQKDVWNSNLPWQPIPVHTIPEKQDHVLAGKKYCEVYDFELNKLKRSEEFVKINKELSPLYKYITKYTGREVSSLEGLQNIYNCLFIETLNNKTLPEWTKEIYPGKLPGISARSFATNTYTPQLARLKIGSLIKEILERFQSKFKSKLKPNRSMVIYSGHDTTIANVLNALGLFEYHNPPYTACILLELRLVSNVPYVQIFYKNTTNEPQEMVIPNCGKTCKLADMFRLYKNILPVDWETECKLSMLSMTYVEADLQSALLVIFCIALTILFVLVFLACITVYRRKDYEDARWYLRVDS